MAGVMDTESRYMLANETYPEKHKIHVYDATKMLKRAACIAKTIPRVFISDILSGFECEFKKAILGYRKYSKKDQKFVHIRTTSVQNHHINNSLFEYQNDTVRNRIKTVRRFSSRILRAVFVHHLLQLYPSAHGHKRQDVGRGHGHSRGWNQQMGNTLGVCVRMLITVRR